MAVPSWPGIDADLTMDKCAIRHPLSNVRTLMKRTCLSLAASALLIAVLVSAPSASASIACGWTQVAGDPNVAAGIFEGVAASGPNQVWAVGMFPGAVIERWDGTRWKAESLPSADSDGSLRAVASLAPEDAWAVGSSSSHHPMALHWDGLSWSDVPMPSSGEGNDFPLAISASEPADVWVGGYTSTPTAGDQALLEHWDGSQWSVLRAPTGQFINGISAVSPSNVWAAVDTGGQDAIAHWDGFGWQEQSLTPFQRLRGIFARTDNDIWAVGYDSDGALVLHWDGTTWTRIPNPTKRPMTLRAVAASSAHRVWVVGSPGHHRPFVERWNGIGWRRTPVGTSYADPFAVTNVPGTRTVWAVGDGPILRYC
jgi:hypothetical protein